MIPSMAQVTKVDSLARKLSLKRIAGFKPGPSDTHRGGGSPPRLTLCPNMTDCLAIAAYSCWRSMSCGKCAIYKEWLRQEEEPEKINTSPNKSAEVQTITEKTAQPPITATPEVAPATNGVAHQQNGGETMDHNSTAVEIAEELGLHKTYVWKIAKQEGITVMGRDEAEHKRLLEAIQKERAIAAKRRRGPRSGGGRRTPPPTETTQEKAPAAAKPETTRAPRFNHAGKLIDELIAENKQRLDELEQIRSWVYDEPF